MRIQSRHEITKNKKARYERAINKPINNQDMTNVTFKNQINKSTYENLEVEEVAITDGAIRVEWGLYGDEENTTSSVSIQTYADWLQSKDLLGGSIHNYWEQHSHFDKCEHMRVYLSYCPSPKTFSVTELQTLAKTA